MAYGRFGGYDSMADTEDRRARDRALDAKHVFKGSRVAPGSVESAAKAGRCSASRRKRPVTLAGSPLSSVDSARD